MARLFAEVPEAVAETLRFLNGIRFSLDELQYNYPDELRAGFNSEQEALKAHAEAGARWRYPQGVPETVRHQLNHELALVEKLQYAAYFLTVHDIVRFAREEKILCQGRGSAANSALCYCLGITDDRSRPSTTCCSNASSRKTRKEPARHRRRFRARAARGP